jgi:hypothetical protein
MKRTHVHRMVAVALGLMVALTPARGERTADSQDSGSDCGSARQSANPDCSCSGWASIRRPGMELGELGETCGNSEDSPALRT